MTISVALMLVWGLLLLAVSPVYAASPVPRILVLNSYNMGYDWWEDEMEGFSAGLTKVFPSVELYIENLDTKKFHTKMHFPAQARLLQAKYAGRPLDVIVAMDNAALEFALQYRQRFSPGTPLVFCGINDYGPKMIVGQSKITGVAEYHDVIGTLGLALLLHPATRDVTVIHDYTDTGLAIRRELERTASRYPSIQLHFMESMPLEETVSKLKMLTPGHLVLLLSYTVEKGGWTFNHSEASSLVSSASPVPVYSVYAAQLGKGVVGGRMIEGQTQGQKAAELVVRIIGGEHSDKLPVITGNLSRPMFDYLVLEKFGINPAKLPADTVFINQPHSTVAISKKIVWMGSLFTLLSALIIVILTVNIRKRKRLEEMLLLKVDQYQESQDELVATEEMLREQIGEYLSTHDQLLAAEEMLRIQLEVAKESSQKFKAVFEHSPITVALTSLPDGTFNEVNRAFIEMFGYSSEEALGKTTLELGVWLYETDRKRFLQLLQGKGHVHNFEVEMRRKDGEAFTVLFSGVLVDISGRPSVLSAIMEITEQVRLQNQLHQSQKMDVIGQLAGGIAHDFNNMLAVIMASAELLKKWLPSDARNHKTVDTIIEAATRSAGLTRELLTFSRKGTVLSSPVRISDVIAVVKSLLERTIDKQIQLVTLLDEDDTFVMGDQGQLQNALLNLGVNARDAMPHGGTLTYATTVKIMDESACRSLDITLPTGRYLEIAVSDTGSGMSKSVMEHIFEPFYTTKAVGKGTGLGLAAVYGTVRSHQGELSVQSEPGVGSVFKIYLPTIKEALVPSICAEDVVVGKGGVLLVEDEELLRDIGRELLEDLGYTVYLAENGAQALEVFSAHREEIALVMLDMIMPKMGGKEAFMKLREQDPEVKVLFCSGFSHEGSEAELVGLGARAFIQKPYSRSELSRAVAEAMEL